MGLFKKLLLPIAVIAVFFSGNSHAIALSGNRYLNRALNVVNALWVGNQNSTSNSLSKQKDKRYSYATFSKKNSFLEILKNHTITSELEQNLREALDKSEYQYVGLKNIIELTKLPFMLKPARAFEEQTGVCFRIIGSLCINQCAQELNLDAVKAPQKKAFIWNNSYYYAVSEKINTNKNMPFSLKQFKQIYKICKRTGYQDITDENIVNTNNQIAYFIDTEQSSFGHPFNKLFILERLQAMTVNVPVEPAAMDWLKQKIQKKQWVS